jgi:site-specific DNA-methyltransferase (adenine-specific)/adenine-specific DNA-methyltransferase
VAELPCPLRPRLELLSASHTYANPSRYTIAVKAINIFGNDTMGLLPVTAG